MADVWNLFSSSLLQNKVNLSCGIILPKLNKTEVKEFFLVLVKAVHFIVLSGVSSSSVVAKINIVSSIGKQEGW